MEEATEFYRYRLTSVIDKANEEGMSRYRLNKYKDLKSLIEVNLTNVIEARDRARRIPVDRVAQEKILAEYHLKTCLADAKELLRTG